MEALKNEIQKILEKYQENETSSTGITGQIIIYELYFPDIVNDIANFIQIVFDPENPFKAFCMPDEVVDKESNEQYLKDIGVRK